ncbi:ankyrin [Byssothecium circinans]|uniref:Ankyrin n=1 Tax=Byssothecium circinans TaxID=147558 RepID=A0A6A5TZI7_9PLEO|nr:ankyrin [Byssothecium circinans]
MAFADCIHIDVDTLPNSPSSPSWESPRQFITRFRGGGPVVTGPKKPTTATGESLFRLAIKLEANVQRNPSLTTLETFLNRYKVSDITAPGTTKIHPLVQEWFDHRDVLKVAVEIGREDIARYLLNEGFSIDGEAILAMSANTELVKMVIEQGKWEINQPTSETTPPILGFFTKNAEMLQWLLARGADPELASSNGRYTILHRAAQYGTIPCISILLAAAPESIKPGSPSADVIIHAATAHTPANDRIPIIHFLLDNGAPIDMVAGCGKYEDQEMHFRDLYAWGRRTALHWAIEHGQVDLVKVLLDRGADVGRKTWSLTTNMKWISVEELAEICGHDDVREVLASRAVPEEAEA